MHGPLKLTIRPGLRPVGFSVGDLELCEFLINTGGEAMIAGDQRFTAAEHARIFGFNIRMVSEL